MDQNNELTNGEKLPLEPTIPLISVTKFAGGNHSNIDGLSIDLEKKKWVIDELLDFWDRNEHPDLRVRIGDEEFKCHRLLLSVYTDIVELAKDSGVLNLPAEQVPAVGFQHVYNWMLHGKTDMERSEIIEMLVVAKYLKIEELVQLAWYMLDQKKLYYEDQAFLVAHKCQLLDSFLHIDTLMMQRIKCFFLTLVASIEFINLPIQNVCALLDSDELAVNTEKEVFFSAVRWLTHDWPTRSQHVSKVIKTIRLTLLPGNFLKQLQSPPIPDEPEINLIIQLPELNTPLNDACFGQTLMHHNDGSGVFNQLYNIFSLELEMPRKFIYHDLASYHKVNPNEPQDEFYYKEFLRYLAILQNLEPYSWSKLQPQVLHDYKPC